MQISRARPDALVGILCLLPFFIGAILLYSFAGGETANFAIAVIFFMIFLASIMFSMYAQKFDHQIKWFDAPELKDWPYLAVGVGGMLAAAFLITAFIPGNIGILIGLGVGGIGLGYALYKTESVFIAWIAHSSYNAIVITLASASIIPLSKSPFYVPSFSFEGVNPSDLVSQIFLQFAAVGLAEELLKVSIAIGVALLFTKNKKVAIGIAVVLWVLLHVILSYPIRL